MNHASRLRLPRPLVTTLLLAFAAVGGVTRAETHRLETLFSPEDWDVVVTVEGKGAKAIAEGMADGAWSLLYHVPDSLTISLRAEYNGSLPDDVTIQHVALELNPSSDVVWEIEGASARTTVGFRVDEAMIGKIVSLNGSIKVTTTDPLIQPRGSFLGRVHLYRPLTVGAGVSGSLMTIAATRPVPYIATNGPAPRVDLAFEPYPDVGVRVEPKSVVSVENSFWLTTDAGGYARTAITAPTSSEIDAAGFVRGTIVLKAVKDGAKIEREQNVSLPFAAITSADGASLVGHEGALFEPTRIFSGELLRPGDIVQVGSEVATERMHLQLRFCNGQGALLQSDYFSGVRATVDRGGGLADPRSVLKVSLKNLASDVASDPRRYGRLLIYKAIGNAVDGFFGIPDPVGWSVTTPGGAVEEWVTEYTEQAYQPSADSQSASAFNVDAGGPEFTTPWAATEFGFFSDGVVQLLNAGTSVRLRGPAGVQSVPCQGMVLAQVAIPGGACSDVGHHPGGGRPPELALSPADGASQVSRTPTLVLRYGATLEDPVQPGSLICRLDGRLVSPAMVMTATEAVYVVPSAEALAPGPHQWEAELRTVAGARASAQSVFQVSTDLPAPDGLRAAVGQTQVILHWGSMPTGVAPGGFRLFRSADGAHFLPLEGTASLRQANGVDATPLDTAFYAVAAIDERGDSGPLSTPLRVRFPGNASGPPVPVTGLSWESGIDGLTLRFDDPAPTFVLWRLERALAASGPFVDLLDGERLTETTWLDQSTQPDTPYWYRLTPYTVDGLSGEAAVGGPATWTRPRAAVRGLTASVEAGAAVHLRWDPHREGAVSGYRVDRVLNGSWMPVARVGRERTTYDDAGLPGGVAYQWRVVAELADGSESPASSVVSARWQPLPAGAGAVRFSQESYRGVEGRQVPVKIIREGGSEGPAFVRYSSFWTSGSASIDVDYEPGAGTLIFNAGETEKTVLVKLLPDAQFESPEEFLTLEIRSVSGGPALGSPASTRVYIAESELLRWATTWSAGTEGLGGTANLEVVRDSASEETVTVEYYFDAEFSTATPGEDFDGALQGTLTFGPGETRKSVSLTIVDDRLKEGTNPETARFRLRNPTGGAAIDTTDPFALIFVLEIRDNDVQPGRAEWVTREVHLTEGQSANLVLRRVGGSDGPLPVFLAARGGSLTQGTDWGLRPDFLQFLDGETELRAELIALPDGVIEGRESVILATFAHGPGPQGPAFGSSLLVTIADPEGGSSGFGVWADDRLGGAPVADREAEADADRDGRPNWREFLEGTDPRTADRAPTPTLRFLEFGGCEVALSVCDDPGFTVFAEFSPDLAWRNPQVDAGTWGPPQSGRREVVFRDYTPGLNSGFVRLRYQWLSGSR